ncbi:MAG: diguanylate cyclase [Candidatus Obscuribacterales bacterium]|nr:diguanylate cyclase [Candidatus Obscuribacterales bacterium]
MADQVRTQLFMMLVQQSGPGALPLSNLAASELLSFFRHIEETLVSQGLGPLLVYWCSHNAKWLLAEGEQYRKLTRDAQCISIFSEEQPDKQDEFCFLVQSQGISIVVYGQLSEEAGNEKIYQCVGSIDPHTVRRAFQHMLPVWQFIDLPEANRLDDIRNNMGNPVTAPHFVAGLRHDWPVVKQRQAHLAGVTMEKHGGMTLPTPDISDDAGRSTLRGSGSLSKPSKTARADKPAEELPTPLAKLEKVLEPSLDSLASAVTPALDDKASAKKGLKDLREVWTNITQETRTVFAPDAQKIIRDIVSTMRISSDLPAILQLAIEDSTRLIRADRGLIWQIVDDELVVTNEFATNGHNCFADRRLGAQESTAIVSEFISRFPDESGSGVIAIVDTNQDMKLRRMSPTLSDLIELGDVRARLVAQIRCRGLIHGFIELQQERKGRDWSEQDAAVLQSVSEILSLVVQQSFDLAKIEADADEMKLINEMSSIFRDSRGHHEQHTLEESVKLFADHTGFSHAQVYRFKTDDQVLVPQISEQEHSEPIDLGEKQNPFVQVFESGKLKMINNEYSKRGDRFFGHDQALIIPLLSESEKLGVLGFWKRKEGSPALRLQDRDLALTVAGSLASFIRANRAIVDLRLERSRASLINEVTNKIQQSLKEVDPVLETLVTVMTKYFHLELCVVSIFDNNTNSFHRSKVDGELAEPDGTHIGEHLFSTFNPLLSAGKTQLLSRSDIDEAFAGSAYKLPDNVNAIMLMPMRQGTSLKGALCLVSSTFENYPSLADMHMVEEVLNHVSVVLSHKELFEQVERQAVTDALTGLYNRRYFQEQLSREMDRHQRFGHPFSYIIIDLDYLKKINDGLGHQYGDVAIKHISSVIKKCVRDVDTTARYGGEEFVVLLPETDIEGARIVAERMCASIREDQVDGVGTVTASLGVATFPYDADDRDKLTELADQALYLAKHQGRNRVCSVSQDLLPALDRDELKASKERRKSKADTSQVSANVVKKNTNEKAVEKSPALSAIDLNLIAEHGILGVLGTVIKMVEARDMYGPERSPRSAEYAGRIAQALHLSKEHSTIISLAAILNILGKLSVDETILQKPGPLTAQEKLIVQNSPSAGARILEPSKQLHRVSAVVASYHEHWDGSGYPKGLKGEDIPLEARIIALVDAYVAMTSDRPYRKALTQQEAAEQLSEGAGKEWDPRLVKLFLSLLNQETVASPSDQSSIS